MILNLLINAAAGHRERRARQEGGQIEVDARHEGPWVAISVADNGAGIEPEASPQLFDPFFTTKPVGEGTGLGLAISHGIITGHGGPDRSRKPPGEGVLPDSCSLNTPTQALPVHHNRRLSPRSRMTGRPGNATMEYLGAIGKQGRTITSAEPGSAAGRRRGPDMFAGLTAGFASH